LRFWSFGVSWMFCQCCTNEEDGGHVMVVADQAAPGTQEEDEDDRPYGTHVDAESPDDIGPPPPPSPPVELATVPPPPIEKPLPTPADPFPPQIQEFLIQIDKEGGTMGIDISAHDGKTLLVGRIKEGAVDRWNQKVGQSFERVRRGDRIMQCNGCGDNSDGILQVLKSNAVLELRIRRVVAFRIAFVGRGKVLGIDGLGLVADASREDKLIVKEVLDGPIRDVNKKNKADLEVTKGDEIAEVNGTAGDARTLMDLLQKVGPIQALIRRPSS